MENANTIVIYFRLLVTLPCKDNELAVHDGTHILRPLLASENHAMCLSLYVWNGSITYSWPATIDGKLFVTKAEMTYCSILVLLAIKLSSKYFISCDRTLSSIFLRVTIMKLTYPQ